jgi:hypothetical protein
MDPAVTSFDPPPLVLADRVARNRDTLSAEIDGEVVALDVAKGACYGLDAVGARIWSMIETPRAIGEVCDALTAVYEVDAETCQSDVLDLFTALHTEGLIEIMPPAPASPPPGPKTP